MSFVRPQKRLYVQPTLTKEDVEEEIRAIVGGVTSGPGGTVYTAGVPSTQPSVSSRLDNRSFTIRAGIKNENKQTPTGVFFITIRAAAPTGTASYFMSLPFESNGISPLFLPKIISWSLSYGNTGTSSGTAKLFYTAPNKSRVQLGAVGGQSWAAIAPKVRLFTEVLSPSVEIAAQGRIEVELAISAGSGKDFVATVMCQQKHVR